MARSNGKLADAGPRPRRLDPPPGKNHLFFAQESPPCRKSADLDDDGGLGLADGLYLVSYLFLGGPAPAAPFERCGTDPTADGLTCDWYPPCR